jgi:hypothetical protein
MHDLQYQKQIPDTLLGSAMLGFGVGFTRKVVTRGLESINQPEYAQATHAAIMWYMTGDRVAPVVCSMAQLSIQRVCKFYNIAPELGERVGVTASMMGLYHHNPTIGMCAMGGIAMGEMTANRFCDTVGWVRRYAQQAAQPLFHPPAQPAHLPHNAYNPTPLRSV